MSSGKVLRGGIIPDHYLRKMPEADRLALGRAGKLPEEIDAKNEWAYETKLQNQIEGLFTRCGITCNRSRMDKRKTDKTGWPDFTFAVRYECEGETVGLACAIECKSPGKELTKGQAEMKERLLLNGWRYFIIRDYPTCISILKSIGVKIP